MTKRAYRKTLNTMAHIQVCNEKSSQTFNDIEVSRFSVPIKLENLRFLPSGPFEAPEDTLDSLLKIDLIREELFVNLLEKKKENSRESICNLRLVSKTFLKYTHEYLHQRKLPLYHFSVGCSNSSESATQACNNLVRLDEFLQSHNTFPSIHHADATYALKLGPEFFRKENYQRLYSCLVNYGGGLVSLKIGAPDNFGTLRCVFPAVSLPVLKYLQFKIKTKSIKMNADEKALEAVNFTLFLQLILNGADSLSEVYFNVRPTELTKSLKYLFFPTSLKFLKCSHHLAAATFQICEYNKVCALESPEINISQYQVKSWNKRLSNILLSLKTSLKSLKIVEKGTSETQNKITLSFPIMQKLETMSINSSLIRLDEKSFLMHTNFPNLTKLDILKLDLLDVEHFMRDNVYKNVKLLKLGNIHTKESQNMLTLEMMQLVWIAFPNLQNLSLEFARFDENGIKFIFMEMRKLEFLSIKRTLTENAPNQDVWDALLTGAPAEVVSVLRAHPEFSERLHTNDDDLPCLRNMKELKMLELLDEISYLPLVSDLAFYLCFFKMPNLRKLSLNGGFKASQKMAEKWEDLSKIYVSP